MEKDHMVDVSEMTKVELDELLKIVTEKHQEATMTLQVWQEELDLVNSALKAFGSVATVH